MAARNESFDVHVLTKFTNPEFRLELERLGVHTHDMPLSRKGMNPLKELVALWSIFKLITRLKPDIVHSVTIKPNLYSGLIGQVTGRPIIASVTGLGTNFSQHVGARAFRSCMLIAAFRMAFRHPATRVLFENRGDLETLVSAQAIDKTKTVLIPGAGVDVATFRHEPLPTSPPVKILFAARLLRNKGLHELLQAVSRLRSAGHEVELVVAGIVDTDAHGTIPISDIEQWAAAGLIDWRGNVTDMPALIRECHVVCLPTKYGEGIPRILIEGAACGRALIGSTNYGCKEIIESGVNGLLADMTYPDSLYNCLVRLIEDRNLLDQMGGEGRRLAEEKFSSTLVIEKTLEIYRKQR